MMAPTPADQTGSAMAGSAAGSAMAMAAGSGSAMAMAGSAAGSAMAAGSASGSAAGSGEEMADMAFDKLSHEDKVKLMKEHMNPEMKTAFQKFDAKKFAKFNCKTCHGKDPAKTKFKMPNPELPKLDFAALKAGKQEPKTAKFMADIVEPQAAKILGAQPYDPKTNKGFGCLGCHVQKE
jgi:hypothetical protein